MGMMEVIGIVPKGADLTANVTSGGVYPWACMKNTPIGLPFKGSASSSYLSISTLVLSLIMYLLVTIMLEKTFNIIIEDQFKMMFETSFIVFINGRQVCNSHASCLHVAFFFITKFLCALT